MESMQYIMHRANKKDISEMLVSMGFPQNYVHRAFKVFEKNYGHDYNVEVITEIIVRLQNKNKGKNECQKKAISDFRPHMTIKEAMDLKVDDNIDYRDYFGRFVGATIVEKQGTNLKIHKMNSKNVRDVWCDYNKELHRFAVYQSISKRVAHRFTHLGINGFVDINPIHKHRGWKQGEIKHMLKASGQIKVVYEHESTNYDYWAHLDDEQEIAEFLSKSLDAQNEDVKHDDEEQKNDIFAFDAHMTIEEAMNLKVNAKVDHRDKVGRFILGTIAEKKGTNLKIHYDGWSRKWDEWTDYTKELHRFAAPGSISKRPAHRFTHLGIGDYIDINPLYNMHKQIIHSGWKQADIRRMDQTSGQVQCSYRIGEKYYLYWVHLDNAEEISAFNTKSIIEDEKEEHQDEVNDELDVKHQESSESNAWFYIDPSGKEQGPFDASQMWKWFVDGFDGFIPAELPIGSDAKMPFVSLEDCFHDGLAAFLDEMQTNEIVVIGRNYWNKVKGVNKNEEEMKYQDVVLTDMIQKELKPHKITAMSLAELKDLKNVFEEKLKLIEDAKKELTENTLTCIACMDNRKNISFIDGCDHVALCDECEKEMERKCCPICNAPYTKVKKIAL